jgi:hypothetical protein
MPLPDGSDLDAAVVDLLWADATLKALVPDGVFMDVAPANAKQFVLVSIMDEHDEDTFEGRAWEDTLYAVRAVESSTVATKNIKAAAARIDQLLERAVVTATGYVFVSSGREQRLRNTEIDAIDKSIRWQHRGGQYRLMATLAAYTSTTVH